MSTSDTTPTPDSAELARLLSVLADDIATMRAVASLHLDGGHRATVQRLARACELLLAERADATESPFAALRAAGFEVAERPMATDTRVRFDHPVTGEPLYRQATPEEMAKRQTVPTVTDLDAARAAAREARERAATVDGSTASHVPMWQVIQSTPALAALVDTLADDVARLRARIVELEAIATAALQWSDARVAHVEHGASADAVNEPRERLFDLVNRRFATTGARQQPAGHRVAALLAAVEARSAEAALDGGSFESGRSVGLDDATRLITTHLGGTPTPLDRAVAEVVAVDVAALVGPEMSTSAIGDAIDRVVDGCEDEPQRKSLAKMGALCLAGMLTCDAPAPASCPSALMHSALGLLPCNVRGPHAEHVSATGERWGSEGVAEHPSFDTRAFFDDDAAKKGDE